MTPAKLDALCEVGAYEGGGGFFVAGLIGRGYATREDAQTAADMLRARIMRRIEAEAIADTWPPAERKNREDYTYS